MQVPFTIQLSVYGGIVVTGPLADAYVGQSYSQQISASGGKGGPYTYSNVTGVPTGLSVSSTGVVSGTPTTAGSYAIMGQVADIGG